MRDNIFRAFIRPLLAAAIRDVAADPRRAVNGLLEKTRPFLDAGTYAKLYEIGMALARDDANLAILRRLAAETDPNLLADTAASAACGALRCVERYRRDGALPRWRAAFDLDATPPAVLERLVSDRRRDGAFLFLLHGNRAPAGLTRLLLGNGGSLFLFFLREVPGDGELKRLFAARNALLFVEADSPEALERARLLAERRCLWGAYTARADAAEIAPWARMVSARAVLACAEAPADCGGACREAAVRAVGEFRRASAAPLFLSSPRDDLERVDRLARKK